MNSATSTPARHEQAVQGFDGQHSVHAVMSNAGPGLTDVSHTRRCGARSAAAAAGGRLHPPPAVRASRFRLGGTAHPQASSWAPVHCATDIAGSIKYLCDMSQGQDIIRARHAKFGPPCKPKGVCVPEHGRRRHASRCRGRLILPALSCPVSRVKDAIVERISHQHQSEPPRRARKSLGPFTPPHGHTPGAAEDWPFSQNGEAREQTDERLPKGALMKHRHRRQHGPPTCGGPLSSAKSAGRPASSLGTMTIRLNQKISKRTLAEDQGSQRSPACADRYKVPAQKAR